MPLDPPHLAWAAAVLAIMGVLFTAPLVLGSYVVVQRATERQIATWVGVLVGLLVVVLLAAGVGVGLELLF
jgi:hypothetical protein